MIFKCRNCGGNTVFSPERHDMFCPYCEGVGTAEKSGAGGSVAQCANCGGGLEIGTYTSASKCPYCDSYLIFDERVEGAYKPNLIIPFQYSKEMTKKLLRNQFKSCIFAPGDFLSDAKLETMTGMYVPFWMYDYHVRGFYDGEGKLIRTWVSGNKQYTETSTYHIVRDMEVDFDKMPVDASEAMPDAIMDLMEPYDYGALEAFKADYMSGFTAEYYNTGDVQSEPRAVNKAKQDAESILKQSINRYTGLKSTQNNQVTLSRKEVNYALLPVWIYKYKYKEKDYIFHVNGQTGKVVGEVPISQGKVWGYGATLFGSLFAILSLLAQLVTLF